MKENTVRTLIRAASDRPADLDTLAQNWQVARIVVMCRGAGALARQPQLGGRVRGALGQQLKHGASEAARNGRPCSWTTPCALDILFAAQGRLTAGLELPKPWAPALRAEGADLRVRLALFGMAASWAGEVADALVRGLRVGLVRKGGGCRWMCPTAKSRCRPARVFACRPTGRCCWPSTRRFRCAPAGRPMQNPLR